jgi:hypothetical protein
MKHRSAKEDPSLISKWAIETGQSMRVTSRTVVVEQCVESVLHCMSRKSSHESLLYWVHVWPQKLERLPDMSCMLDQVALMLARSQRVVREGSWIRKGDKATVPI